MQCASCHLPGGGSPPIWGSGQARTIPASLTSELNEGPSLLQNTHSMKARSNKNGHILTACSHGLQLLLVSLGLFMLFLTLPPSSFPKFSAAWASSCSIRWEVNSLTETMSNQLPQSVWSHPCTRSLYCICLPACLSTYHLPSTHPFIIYLLIVLFWLNPDWYNIVIYLHNMIKLPF